MLNKRKRLFLVGVVGIISMLSLLIVSCAPEELEEPEERLQHLNLSHDPASFEIGKGLDLTTCRGGVGTVVGGILADGLVRIDVNGVARPALAKSWEIASDWSTADFYLDETARFHNGDPVTAADVLFSFEKFMDPESGHGRGAEYARMFSRIEIVDDYHIRFHLTKPYPNIFERMGHGASIVPKDYYEEVGADYFSTHPVYAGPFKFREFEDEVYMTADAVTDHYRKSPYIDSITFRNIHEPMTRMALMRVGKLDVFLADPAQVQEILDDPVLRIFWSENYSGVGASIFDLIWPEPSPLKDKNVLWAMELAIDKETICTEVLGGAAVPTNQWIAPYQLGFDPTIPPTPYDPVLARQLIADAGYPDGFDTEFHIPTERKSLCEPIVAMWADVGIRCELLVHDSSWLWMAIGEGSLRGMVDSWGPKGGGLVNPWDGLDKMFVSTRHATVTDPGVVEAINALLYLVDEEEIAAAAKEINLLIFEAGIRIPVFNRHTPFAIAPTIPVGGFLCQQSYRYPTLFEYVLMVSD